MSSKTSVFSLSYLPLMIRLQCCDPVQLPPFLGSTLHGVLGWKIVKQPAAYKYLFENRRFGASNQDIVNPYLIQVPRYRSMYRHGDMLCFKLILLGNAVDYLNDVLEALTNEQCYELGASRKKFRLVDILHGEQFSPIWRNGGVDVAAATSEVLTVSAQSNVTRCSIQYITPLRIRRNGELLQNIDFPAVIRNITRRVAAVTERYGGHASSDTISELVEWASAVRTISSGLYLSEVQRYSNRRSKTMDMSGMLGAMTLEGDLTPFVPWLNAARTLHIGRNTTFGCGQVDVVFA
ncbi:CRISPR system precrRNA processing endoribonuclease RAMP protein Cas6 [Paenibacillus arenosi]|uniref:CRISPR system precrRNA processing endoribonuclease RAMP protein Cas6 n=1 Tax=Paenibacillus arenosi TaxID=2774142 RepID=A0ABR9AZH1_9BACL|nr:CRISPR system precrRNA processing endoribonuclease RAMP protein Cas6 [Paenibacillus arenosi]MBD8499547.1 CRISPR system precrRNA processing endoribonuclease RAMP protein Cas6 [Paenibacillus arenosi]